MSPRQTEAEVIRSQIADLRARLRELEPAPTREQVKGALRAQDAGSTLKEYARTHHLDLGALYRAASERRRWERRVREFGPGLQQAGPEP